VQPRSKVWEHQCNYFSKGNAAHILQPPRYRLFRNLYAALHNTTLFPTHINLFAINVLLKKNTSLFFYSFNAYQLANPLTSLLHLVTHKVIASAITATDTSAADTLIGLTEANFHLS
jgi:hypothetical protein